MYVTSDNKIFLQEQKNFLQKGRCCYQACFKKIINTKMAAKKKAKKAAPKKKAAKKSTRKRA
jgi:hypothetical protein